MGILILWLILLAGLLWLDWYLANQFSAAARQKGHHDRKYFWICFWLGLVGYLLVIALPDRGGCTAAHGNSNIFDELPNL